MTEEEFNELHKLNNLDACIGFMKVMTDFYYDTILATSAKPVHTQALSDARIWFQMMFSKGVHFTKALEGFEYRKGTRHLKSITDHTVLYSLVRDMYESYIVFRLIYTHPNTQEQKDILYYLFVHAGLQEKFDNIAPKVKDQDPEWTQDQKEQMKFCRQKIYDNAIYKSDPEVKKVVDNALKSGVNKFRYHFTDDGKMEFVHFEKEETVQLLKINSSFLDGIYHFFSQMAHPSYVALDQFTIAYRNLEKGSIMLACTATRYALTILSLFVREYGHLFDEVDKLFAMQDEFVQILISAYGDIVIKDAYQRSHPEEFE